MLCVASSIVKCAIDSPRPKIGYVNSIWFPDNSIPPPALRSTLKSCNADRFNPVPIVCIFAKELAFVIISLAFK